MSRLRSVICWALCLTVTSSGCSWMMVEKVPDPILVPQYPVSCSDSKVAPVLDTVCAGVLVANAVSAAQYIKEEPVAVVAVAEMVALATLCGFSAYSGYTRTARCREVKELNARCMAGQAEACTTLRPGWTPGQTFPFPAFKPAAAPPAR